MRKHIFRAGFGLRFVLEWLAVAGGMGAGWAVLAMAVLVTINVMARWLLGAEVKGVTEFTSYLLAIAVFVGLAYTLRRGKHITITFLVTRLPEKAQHWLKVVTSSIFLGYAAFLCFLSWNCTLLSFVLKTTSRSGTDVIVWPFQIWIPIGLALLSLVLILNIHAEIWALFSRKLSEGANLCRGK